MTELPPTPNVQDPQAPLAMEPEAQGRAVLEWLEEDRGERSSLIVPFLASVPFSCTGTMRSELLERIADVDTLPLGNKTKENLLIEVGAVFPPISDTKEADLEAYVKAVLRFLRPP